MIIEAFKKVFATNLAKLASEIELYKDETAIWKTDSQVTNSAGNLCCTWLVI